MDKKMYESYEEIITLSLFMLVSIVYADSDCPMVCDCDVEDGTLNLSCGGKIPDTLPLNTRVVNITDIKYKYLDQFRFNHFQWANVTKLYLHGGSVNSIMSYTFSNVRNLTHLKISFPNLYYISINALMHLTKLQTLDLSGNTHLSFDDVVNALRLTEFTSNLDELNLQSLARFEYPGELDETFFFAIQRFKIKRLHLSYANINKVYPGALSMLGSSIEELQMIDVDLNSIVSYFNVTFTQQMFPNLQCFDMSFARIKWMLLSMNLRNYVGIYDCFFPPFQARNLVMNNIISETVTQQNVTYKSRNCNRDTRGRIEIMNNNIRLLNINFDPHMPMYHEVDLSNNVLEYLSINATSHFKILEWVSLAHNKLGAMDIFVEFVDLFALNVELKYIDMSFNKLKRLPRDFFLNNRKLKTIILSNNLLNSQLFRIEHLNELEYFDISNNKILFLDSDILHIFDSMSFETETNHSQFSVNLAGNILKCKCDTISFIQWTLPTKVTLVDRENYICEMQKNVIQINENTLRDTKQLCERTKLILMATLIPLFSAGMLVIIGIFIICTYRRYLKLRQIKLLIEKYRKGDPPNKHLVFLSFCNNDRDFVYRYILDQLRDALSERLCALKDDIVCIGDVQIEPGRYILDEIVRCTESCCVVLLVVSEAFCRSHYCDFEALCAELEKKPILLMILEEVDPKVMSQMMYKHFQRYTRVKWTRNGDEFELVPCWAKFCDSICTIASEKAQLRTKIAH